jgi:nucleotide-binding universal stress UspA family protein
MTEQNPNPVVVAVGSEPVDAALQYGVAEAQREGCGVHLVHVVHVVATGPETVLVDATDAERIGRETLEEALEKARDLAPDEVAVTGQVFHGAPVPALVSAVPDARLIVLQRRSMSRIMRIFTRSVSSGVAARAHVPVTSVPDGWSPADPATEQVVTVGVDDPERSGPILAAAVASARSRGAELRVLHTWWYPGVYDDIITRRTEDDEWAERARLELQAALDKIGTDGVKVTIDARHAFPADALVEASHHSELLVVGRHDPLVPFGSHLGPVSRAVLHAAVCPVMLADPRRHGQVSA